MFGCAGVCRGCSSSVHVSAEKACPFSHPGTDDSVVSEDRLNETELTDLEGQQDSPPKTYLCLEEEKSADHPHGDGLHALHVAVHNHHGGAKATPRKHGHAWHHKHSHHSHGPCHSGSDLKDTGIASIAWMVIMGDGIHNFSDGLAIGAWGQCAAARARGLC